MPLGILSYGWSLAWNAVSLGPSLIPVHNVSLGLVGTYVTHQPITYKLPIVHSRSVWALCQTGLTSLFFFLRVLFSSIYPYYCFVFITDNDQISYYIQGLASCPSVTSKVDGLDKQMRKLLITCGLLPIKTTVSYSASTGKTCVIWLFVGHGLIRIWNLFDQER